MALESEILASLFQVISFFFTLKISVTRTCRLLLCIVTALSSSGSSLKNRFLF